MDLDVDARVDERADHLGAEVLQLVSGRDREVALLVPRTVREVGRSVRAGVPDAFFRVDVVVAEVLRLIEAQRVEDVELDLRTPERRVGDAGRWEELFGLLRDVAGVARVRLARDRIEDVADQVERLHLEDRVDERRGRVRDQEHVALVDVLEPSDRRAIEPDAVAEEPLGELLDGDRKVLPRAGHVDEAQVDDLDLLVFRELQDLLRRRLRFRRRGGRGTLDGQGHVHLPTRVCSNKALATGVRGELPQGRDLVLNR